MSDIAYDVTEGGIPSSLKPRNPSTGGQAGLALSFGLVALFVERRRLSKRAREEVGQSKPMLVRRGFWVGLAVVSLAVGFLGYVGGKASANAVMDDVRKDIRGEIQAIQSITSEIGASRSKEMVNADDYARMYAEIEPKVRLWKKHLDTVRKVSSPIARHVQSRSASSSQRLQIQQIFRLSTQGLTLQTEHVQLLEKQINLSKEMERLSESKRDAFFNKEILPLLQAEEKLIEAILELESKAKALSTHPLFE